MKSFVEYLIESSKTYEFRIKIAGELSDEHMERIENHMERFGLESISKPKKTPIQKQPAGFAEGVTNSSVSVMEIVTNYPATPQQIGAILQDIIGLPESHVVVVNKNDPEEIAREVASGAKEEEYKPILGNDYDEEKLDPSFGDEYNSNFLKELETRKYEFATKNNTKAKTSNDLPINTKSPIAGK
jgi:hypothetical protein